MKIKDIMSQNVITIGESDSVAKAAAEMQKNDIGFLPVTANGKFVGVITDRDITCRAAIQDRNPKDIHVGDIMSTKPVWCQANEDVEDAIRLMENRQVRRLPVLDSHEKIVGMLSLGNVSTHVSHELSGEAIEAISRPSPKPPSGTKGAQATAA